MSCNVCCSETEYKANKIDEEPDWFTSKLNSPRITYIPPDQTTKGFHLQDDFLKPFLLDIVNYGLYYAYEKYYGKSSEVENYKYMKTKYPKKVIIVGAGMSGLVAGYELSQAGHEVLILEEQHRVGGRVKTIGNGSFSEGLWAEAGAMREPGTGEKGWSGPSHFMTDFYIQKFQLPVKEFVNFNDQAYYAFHGKPPIKIADWKRNPGKYCDEFWPEWRKNIKADVKIPDINAYWEKTSEPIKDQLYKYLATDPMNAWSRWIQKWSRFSINDLLKATFEEVLLKLKSTGSYELSDDAELNILSSLLPWSSDARAGYRTMFGGSSFDAFSITELLKFEVGKYYSKSMYTIETGMETLPWTFLKNNHRGWNTEVKLSKCVKFGVKVEEIQYSEESVTVVCHNKDNEANTEHYKGDLIIVTVPLHIACQIKFSPSLPTCINRAMKNVHQSPAAKVMLQCKTRFWEAEGIQGGYTSSDMPIVKRICYPTNHGFKIPINERGILTIYYFCGSADTFIAASKLTTEGVIAEVIKETGAIHPKIHESFEFGVVQFWSNKSSALGLFCMPESDHYLAHEVLFYPYQSVYFSGNSMSSCCGWIQGAIVSGLRSAYQVFSRNELRN